MYADGLDKDTLKFQERQLEDQFQRVVLPFVETHCVSCHGPRYTEAKFDISGFRSLRDVVVGHRHWDLVLEKLVEEEMPPEDEEQPSAESRLAVIQWIEASRHHEALLNAGHPGCGSRSAIEQRGIRLHYSRLNRCGYPTHT